VIETTPVAIERLVTPGITRNRFGDIDAVGAREAGENKLSGTRQEAGPQEHEHMPWIGALRGCVEDIRSRPHPMLDTFQKHREQTGCDART
jgi:hypothetical protein